MPYKKDGICGLELAELAKHTAHGLLLLRLDDITAILIGIDLVIFILRLGVFPVICNVIVPPTRFRVTTCLAVVMLFANRFTSVVDVSSRAKWALLIKMD